MHNKTQFTHKYIIIINNDDGDSYALTINYIRFLNLTLNIIRTCYFILFFGLPNISLPPPTTISLNYTYVYTY